MEREFKRHVDSLGQVFDFISDFVASNQLDDAIAFSTSLVIEELFTNMVKYHPESLNDISISLDKDEKKLIIGMVDSDVEPFDITKSRQVNVNQGLQDRKVGGLGLHLVKKLMDDVKYEYSDRRSKITLIKNLENGNA